MGIESYGARWWRFDFHTHSPASYDYGRGPDQVALSERSPRQWLLDFMAADIDCVAITDHNTAEWIDKLKAQYQVLEHERPQGFRELHLFPGVELTVHGGAHLLAIFDPDTTGLDLIQLLAKVGLSANPEYPSSLCTEDSFPQVVRSIIEAGGIAIPAHADDSHGVLNAYSGQTLQQILQINSIIAAEVSDARTLQSGPAGHQCVRWTPVLGSDSHHPSGQPGQRYPGSHFTWVKMGHPSIEGLRLALLDGASLSVMRSVDEPGDPNTHADLVVESVTVSEAMHAGRGIPLRLTFSPWMTSIIGGRGTGKSTVLEMMRLCLRRENEVPEELLDDLGRFATVALSDDAPGGLTDDTKVIVEMRKGGDLFRVLWSQNHSGPVIQRQADDGAWKESFGEVRTRFPIRIFSQKQVLALASRPESLLHLVDESRQVDGLRFGARRDELETRFLSIRSELRALGARLKTRERIKGTLEDLNHRINIIEKSDYRDVLVAYRRARRQSVAFRSRRQELGRSVELIRKAANEVEPSDVNDRDFDTTDAAESDALDLLRRAAQTQRESAAQLRQAATDLDEFTTDFRKLAKSSKLQGKAIQAKDNYDSLKANLEVAAIKDPNEFSSLIQQRQAVEGQLRHLDQIERQVQTLNTEARDVLADLEALHLDLAEQRRAFLRRTLTGNPFVRMKLVPFGNDPAPQESDFRRSIAKEDGRLASDIWDPAGSRGILAELYRGLQREPGDERAKEVLRRVRTIKRDILAEREEVGSTYRTKWFGKHIRSLPPEQIDRIQLWWPADTLQIEYRRPQRSGWSTLESGSPGQKSAALLAFLLSYGEEPLILDQPEDDLDNHLIYDLIVKQIRGNKRRRQVIVATHNPNIVVNGDAEQVVTMDFRRGQCEMFQDGTGCLQEMGVREEICRVMEGGRKAFDARHQRLAIEVQHAT